jgi:transcriptional regulator with XRE-family HTH domain
MTGPDDGSSSSIAKKPKHKKSGTDEARIKAALEQIRLTPDKDGKQMRGVQAEIARKLGLHRSTISRRLRNQTKSRYEAHAGQMLVSDESLIVEYIRQVQENGGYASIVAVMTLAQYLLDEKLAEEGSVDVSGQFDKRLYPAKPWCGRFRRRHPELNLETAVPIEDPSWLATHPDVVRNFVDDFSKRYLKDGMKKVSLIMSVDEVAFKIAESGRSIKTVKYRDPRVRDASATSVINGLPVDNTNDLGAGNSAGAVGGYDNNITVIEGTFLGFGEDGDVRVAEVLPPGIIFKGKEIYSRNLPQALIQASFSEAPLAARTYASDRGYPTEEIFHDWILNVFEKCTKEFDKPGKYRLILLDGHSTHYGYKFLRTCVEHNIIPIVLPAHTAHALQPINVGLYETLRNQIASELAPLGNQGLSVAQFLDVYLKARETVYSGENVAHSFKLAGIFPADGEAVAKRWCRTETQPNAQIRVTREFAENEADLLAEPIELFDDGPKLEPELAAQLKAAAQATAQAASAGFNVGW